MGKSSQDPTTESPEISLLNKPGMIVHSSRFLELEMPMSALRSWITPLQHFFVRSHAPEPIALDPNTWTIKICGEVERPYNLTMADVRQFPSASVTNTLECAGNGRHFFGSGIPGARWQRGAIGTAVFSGIRLKDVLLRAGVKVTGRHVTFRGLDEFPGEVPPFIRSIPVKKAFHPDTLLATGMNHAPLPKVHGFPIRALVPGWIGAASVKWLTEIRVLQHESDAEFMMQFYRMPQRSLKPGEQVSVKDTDVITALPVKSIIVRPLNDDSLKLGPVETMGAAWAGENEIAHVDVSTDSGHTWNRAQLSDERAPYSWRLWNYVWRPKEIGHYLLMSRASDSQGRVQPVAGTWNPGGYLYNAIDQVKINVQR
jgi:DMSO/TMAO reductase YedYZ molybdopterin-dependent catalytic subunit